MTALIKYEAARRALAEAVAVDEVLQIRDQAEALRHAARIARDQDLEIQAAQLRFRAERRLGELIAAQKAAGGLAKGAAEKGWKERCSDEEQRLERPATLAEAGIDRKLSSRAQRVAELPAEKFDALVKQHGDEMRAGTGRVAMDLLKVNADQDGREARRELAIQLSDKSAALPTGRKYAVIYADAPWRRKQGVTSRSYENHYPTMTWSEICAMPVADLALPDAWLFLWIPRAHAFALHKVEVPFPAGALYGPDGEPVTGIEIEMPLAWAVAKAWGFDSYSTAFVWTKTDEDHPDEAGGAVLVRDQDELLLLFKRGNGLPKPANGEKFGSNHRERSKPLGHSAKPQHYRRMIATMAGRGVPVLEMFARFDADNPPPPGWDLWGNQAKPQNAAPAETDTSAWDEERLRRQLASNEERLWLHPSVTGKHTVTMTCDYPDDVSFDVATCQCGWSCRHETAARGAWRCDDAVDSHWREMIAANEAKQIAENGSISAAVDQPAAPAASPTPDDRIVDTETDENPFRSETAVPPAGRPGSASIELSELDALKLISDFCHPKRAELLPRLGPEYAQRGLAIEQSATGEWILRDAGWTRLRELEAERRAREPAKAIEPHPLDIPQFLRRAPKKPAPAIEPQLALDLARVDLEPPEVVDGKLQTRMPLGEDELEIRAALLAVDAGEIANREAFRLAEGRGYLHVTTSRIVITEEGRAFLAQVVTPAPAADLEARA